MTTIQNPNWLAITGLIFAFYGAIVLAGAVGAGARWSRAAETLSERADCLRQLGVVFAVVLLSIGFMGQIAANLVVVEFGGPVVLSWLVLAFSLLVYWMHVDLWAVQMTERTLSARDAIVAGTKANDDHHTTPVRLVAQA